MVDGYSIRIVEPGIGKARRFADSQRKKDIKACVRLARMSNGKIRAIVRYTGTLGESLIFDPQLGYAYKEKTYPDYSRCRILRETPLGRTIDPGKAALRLFRMAKDAVE
jgi:hypothetical protein